MAVPVPFHVPEDTCPSCDPAKVRNYLASTRLALADAATYAAQGDAPRARDLVDRTARTLAMDANGRRKDRAVLLLWAGRLQGTETTPAALTALRTQMYEQPLSPAPSPEGIGPKVG